MSKYSLFGFGFVALDACRVDYLARWHRSCAISQYPSPGFWKTGKEGIRLAWCNAWFMGFVVSGLLLVRWNLLKMVVCAMARDRGVRGGRQKW